MIVVGLTGPTGAGKGIVGAYLAAHGALIIDTDRIAREVVEPGQPCLRALVDVFSPSILHADGSLDRAALATVAFADEAAHGRLNATTHPFIIERSLVMLRASEAEVAVIDAPLLFESGMDRLCDVTVAVLAPAETRLARIMARDGIDRDRAVLRMKAQPPDAFYRERADHILNNDGDVTALERAAQMLFMQIKEGPDGGQ